MGLGSSSSGSSAESPCAVLSSVSCITAYSQRHHAGVLSCRFDAVKGRVLHSERHMQAGEKILTEPPLTAVRCDPTNALYLKVEQLCEQHGFALDPIWYWCALNSVYPDTAPSREGLKAVDKDTREALRLLHAPDPISPSAEVKKLLQEFQLEGYVTAEDLELMLQVWIHNCFEQYDDPVGFVIFFLPSFTSHSCLPNAFWYFDADNNFVLRARANIGAGEEISLSYLSEDDLLKPTLLRRQILSETKSFWCTCERCSCRVDFSRGFRCMRCGVGCIYVKSTAALSNEEVEEVLAAHADSSASDFLRSPFVSNGPKRKGKADVSAGEAKTAEVEKKEGMTVGGLMPTERSQKRDGRDKSCEGAAGGSVALSAAENPSFAALAAAAAAGDGGRATSWKEPAATAAAAAAGAVGEDAETAEASRRAAGVPAGNEAVAAAKCSAAAGYAAAAGGRDAAAAGLDDTGQEGRSGAAAAAGAAEASCRTGGGVDDAEAKALLQPCRAAAAEGVSLNLYSSVKRPAAGVTGATAATTVSVNNPCVEIAAQTRVWGAAGNAAAKGATGCASAATRVWPGGAAAAACSSSERGEVFSPRFAAAAACSPRRNGKGHPLPASPASAATSSLFSSSVGSCKDSEASVTPSPPTACRPSAAASSSSTCFPTSSSSSACSSKLRTTQDPAAAAATSSSTHSSSAFLYSVEEEQSWLPTHRCEIPLAIWLLLTAPPSLLTTRVAGARAAARRAVTASSSSSRGEPATSSEGTCFETYAVLSELQHNSSRRGGAALAGDNTAAAAKAGNGCGASGEAAASGGGQGCAAEDETAAAAEGRWTAAATRGTRAAENEWAAGREDGGGAAATRLRATGGLLSTTAAPVAAAADEEAAAHVAAAPREAAAAAARKTIGPRTVGGDRSTAKAVPSRASAAEVPAAADNLQGISQGGGAAVRALQAMWGDPEKLRSFTLSVLFDLKRITQLMAAAVPDVCTTCSSKWSEEEKKRCLAVEACVLRWGSPWGPPLGEAAAASGAEEDAAAATETAAAEAAAERARAATEEQADAAAVAAPTKAVSTAAANREGPRQPAPTEEAAKEREAAAEEDRAAARSRRGRQGRAPAPAAWESPVFSATAADGAGARSKYVRRTSSHAPATLGPSSSSCCSGGVSDDSRPTSAAAIAPKVGGGSDGIRSGVCTTAAAEVFCNSSSSRHCNSASERSSDSNNSDRHHRHRATSKGSGGSSSNDNQSNGLSGCSSGDHSNKRSSSSRSGSRSSRENSNANTRQTTHMKRHGSKKSISHRSASVIGEKGSSTGSTDNDSRCVRRTSPTSSSPGEENSSSDTTGREHSSNSWQTVSKEGRKRRSQRNRPSSSGGAAMTRYRPCAHAAEALVLTSTWASSSMAALTRLLKKPWAQLDTQEKDLLHGLLFNIYGVHWHVACWLQERLCEYTGKDLLLAGDALAWQQRNLYPGVSAALGWSLNSLADTFLQSYADQREKWPAASRASVEKLLLDARGRAACSESHFLLFLLFQGCSVVSSSLLRLNSLMREWITAHALEDREESAPWVEMLQHQQQQHQRQQDREDLEQQQQQQPNLQQQQQRPQSPAQQHQQLRLPMFYSGFTSPALVFEPDGACTLVDRHLCCR